MSLGLLSLFPLSWSALSLFQSNNSYYILISIISFTFWSYLLDLSAASISQLFPSDLQLLVSELHPRELAQSSSSLIHSSKYLYCAIWCIAQDFIFINDRVYFILRKHEGITYIYMYSKLSFAFNSKESYLYTLTPYIPLHAFKNNKEPKRYQPRVSAPTSPRAHVFES